MVKIDFKQITVKIKQIPPEQQLAYLAIAIGLLLIILAILIW